MTLPQTHLVTMEPDDDAVPPQWAVGQVNPPKNARTILNATTLPPPPAPAEVIHKTDDGKYTFVIKNNIVDIIRNSDQRQVAIKTCTDHSHAINSVIKWKRDPAAFGQFLAENV